MHVTEERFAKAFQVNPEALMICRAEDGQISAVNDAWRELLQLRPEVATGRNALDLGIFVVPDDYRRAMEQFGERGSLRNFALSIRRQNGEVRTVSLSLENLAASGDSSLLVVLRDLTPHKPAETALAQKSARLQLLFDVAAQLLSTDDIDRFVESIFQRLRAHLELAGYLHYRTVERQPDRMRLAAYSGISERIAARIRHLRSEEAICGRALQMRAPVALAAVQQSDDPKSRLLRSLGVTAYASFPLMTQTSVHGTIGFARRELDRFTPDELSLLHTLAGLIATAIERKQAERAVERQARMLDISHDAIFVWREPGGIEFWNKGAEELYGYTAGEALGQGGHELLRARLPMPWGEIEGELRKKGIWQGEVHHSTKDGRGVTVSARYQTLPEAEGATSMLVLESDHDLTEEKNAAATLRMYAHQQATVACVSQWALAGGDVQALMNELGELTTGALGVDFCEIVELLPQGEMFLLRAGIGWRSGLVGRTEISAGPEFQAGFTLIKGGPVLVDDLRAETRFRSFPWVEGYGVVSGMSVIVHGRGTRPYGVFSVYSRKLRSFTQDDVNFLQAMANVLATAIDRRRLEQEVLEAGVREQQRIGQDLHDGLCQELAGIQFLTSTLARQLESVSPGAAEQAKEISVFVRASMGHARTLARRMMPVDLEKRGLIATLQEFVTTTAKLTDIRCEFHSEESVLICDQTTAAHIYRIVQEAFNNAIKHSKASTLSLLVRSDGDSTMVSVADDGIGLPQTASRPEGEGMGLRTMTYRAGLIGAKLDIQSAGAGRGTIVTCAFRSDA